MDAIILQKIEELTLYTIELNKQVQEQNKRLAKLRKENAALKDGQEKSGRKLMTLEKKPTSTENR